MNDMHLIPQAIIEIVAAMKSSNPDARLAYEKRLMVIREFIDKELPPPSLPPQQNAPKKTVK